MFVKPCASPLLPLVLSGGTCLFMFESARAQTTPVFQSSFMRQVQGQPDDAGAQALRALTASSELPPGRYRVSVLFNNQYVEERELAFSLRDDGTGLAPCLSREQLQAWGLNVDGLEQALDSTQGCFDLERLVPGASSRLDSSQLQLLVSVPQIALRKKSLGHIDPEHWDSGINAAFVNYQASTNYSRGRQVGERRGYDLYLTSGVNLGPWQLRSNNVLRENNDSQREWTRAYTYVQRDLPGTHSRLTLGETYTPGDVFKSLPIQGVQVASDLGMLPDAMQGYAPIIRGVAQTRAKVEILQNGYPVYSTYVSPGAYEIDDLNTGGGSGELEIIVTESDGQVRRFTQPYANLGNLMREGIWRYSSSLGRYNAFNGLDDPLLWQGSLAMGVGNATTLYGGLLASEYYRAANLGVGKDLGSFGALSFDATRSMADIDSANGAQDPSGMSYAIKYGKTFVTRTHLRFAGYRYSTEGYRDFDEAVSQRARDANFLGSRRSRLEAAVYQNIGQRSAINLTYSQEDYWDKAAPRRQFQFNLSTQHGQVGYNLFASQSLDNKQRQDRQVGLSLSMALGTTASRSATFDVQENGGRYSQRASLTGYDHDTALSYRAAVANDQQNHQSADLSLGYQGARGSLGAGFTQASNHHAASMNASGSVLLHGGGLTLGSQLGETSGLVEVPDVADVGVRNGSSARTDAKGFAVLPHLQPYRLNQIELDPRNLGPDIEIDNGVSQSVPRRGALVKTTFSARKVERWVVTLRDREGRPLPFGASLHRGDGTRLGLVGQAGQTVLSLDGLPDSLAAQWGDEHLERCELSLDAQRAQLREGYHLLEATCR
jgi:outer membrane usher protein